MAAKKRSPRAKGAGNNGQSHDYVPDFIIRLKAPPANYVILETKGFDPLADVKAAAAERWVAAVNADRRFGHLAVRGREEGRPGSCDSR